MSWIGTAVNRALDEWTRPTLHGSAYATGLSFRNRFWNGNYEVSGSAAASHVAGSEEAVLRTQRNAVHYFQQPGEGASVDSTRTTLAGHAANLTFGKYAGGITRFETSVVYMSPGFEVNDIGYLRRADLMSCSTWASLQVRDATPAYRWLTANVNHWQTWNASGLRIDNGWNANAHVGLHSN